MISPPQVSFDVSAVTSRNVVTLSLDSLVPHIVSHPGDAAAAQRALIADAPTTTHDPQSTPAVRPKRARAPRRGRGRGAAASRHRPFHLPAEVATSDMGHRCAGVWAIDAVNPNSWDSTLVYLEKSAADIVAVQEIRRRAEQTADAVHTAATKK